MALFCFPFIRFRISSAVLFTLIINDLLFGAIFYLGYFLSYYLQLLFDELTSWQVPTQFFKTQRRNSKLVYLLSPGWILCGFFFRRLEKHVHFVTKKLEKYIISYERLDFLVHTARHSVLSFLETVFRLNLLSNM